MTAHAESSAAMILVFLAFGGWSDAATLSAEVRDGRRGIFIAMLGALALLLVLFGSFTQSGFNTRCLTLSIDLNH